jgi:hypothetical protein
LHQKNRRDRWQVCIVADDTSRRSLSLLSPFCSCSSFVEKRESYSSFSFCRISILLRLCISFCSRHCCTLVLAPSISSSSSGSGSSVQKRESHTVLYLVRAGNHFSFHRSPHNTTLCPSVCTVSLPPSFLRSIMVIMQVPMALHAQNRQKLLDRLRAQLEAAGRDSTNGVILLQVLSILPTTTSTSTTSLPPCLALPCLSFLSCLLPPWDWCWAQRTNSAVGFQLENQELMTVEIVGFLCVLEFFRFCSFVKTDWCSLTEFFLV